MIRSAGLRKLGLLFGWDGLVSKGVAMRKVGIVVACAAMLAFGLAGCSGSAGSSSAQGGSSSAVVEKQAVTSSSASSAATSAASNEDYSQKVSIEGEYAYESGNNSIHILIVKNNSDATLKISSNSTALDAGGSLIGADDADTSAVGPGCTSYLKEYFSKVTGANKYETKLSASVDKNASVLQDLELTANPAGSNVVLQCTNNGGKDARFVQALVLFFNGDTLVDSGEKYLSSGSEALAPGDTKSEQVSTRQAFDSVSAYLSGRG